jgi:bacterioferritin (cytochrome b1)
MSGVKKRQAPKDLSCCLCRQALYAFQERGELGCRFELRNRIEFLEGGSKRIAQTPHGPRSEFLELRIEVELVHASGQVLRRLQIALDERVVNDEFCSFIRGRHIDWLEAQLHVISGMGIENYLAQQLHEEKS